MVKAIKLQQSWDSQGMKIIANISAKNNDEDYTPGPVPPEEEADANEQWLEAWDDVNGGALNAEDVRKARK